MDFALCFADFAEFWGEFHCILGVFALNVRCGFVFSGFAFYFGWL